MEEMNKNIEKKKDEKGASAVEYALIVSLIGVVIIGGAGFLGTQINTKFNKVGGDVSSAGN